MSRYDTPLPPEMQGMPRDRRGYPIPFIVSYDKAGEPLFTINDQEKTMLQAEMGLCGICGGAIELGQFHFLGGPASAFHPAGAYIDGPVHHACGRYALLVCPYLAAPRYAKRLDTLPAMKNGVAFVATIDPTMFEGRPPAFVMIRTTSYRMTLGVPHERRFLPVGRVDALASSASWRMLDFEVWVNGAEIEDDAAAMELIREGLADLEGRTPAKPVVQPVARID